MPPCISCSCRGACECPWSFRPGEGCCWGWWAWVVEMRKRVGNLGVWIYRKICSRASRGVEYRSRASFGARGVCCGRGRNHSGPYFCPIIYSFNHHINWGNILADLHRRACFSFELFLIKGDNFGNK
jgi:hypothetical protein